MAKQSIDPTAIKLGTRVRHAEDGAEGRIVWANAQAVKFEWDDGEKVTWKRAELAAKGLEVLDDDQGTEPQEATPAVAPDAPAPAPTPATEERTEPTPGATEAAPAPEGAETQPDAPAGQPGQAAPEAAPAAPEVPAVPPARKRAKRATPAEAKPGKPSALDAAAKVLAEEGRPMGCQELIGLMAAKGYWASPGGKTPAATLYSAMLREQQVKGDQARFVKVGRGQFALRPQS